MPARLATLTLLIKVSETVTDYRGHRRTFFFLPRIISLFITCIGIIWNNSLVESRPSYEAGTRGMSPLSRSTAHGARACYPLRYMGRSKIFLKVCSHISEVCKQTCIQRRWLQFILQPYRRQINKISPRQEYAKLTAAIAKICWHCSMALDLQLTGRRFKSQSVRFHVI